MSQATKILEKLNEHRWVCSAELADGSIVDYRARINDLRKKGYLIRGEACKGRCGRNHSANLNWWYLETQSTSLYGMNVVTDPKMPQDQFKFTCCPSFHFFKTHAPDCVTQKEKLRQGALNL